MIKENGKVILGTKECGCDNGMITPIKRCPRYDMKQNRIPCEYCGSTNKDGHKYLPQPKIICPRCNGTRIAPESICDNIPEEWWAEFNFKVYKVENRQEFNEKCFTLKVCYMLTDYGMNKDKPDEELIAEVKKHPWMQASKVVNRDFTLADEIAILRNRNGYSVVAMFRED